MNGNEKFKMIMFMFYDQGLYTDIVNLSERNQYVIDNDQDLKIISLTSKIFHTNDFEAFKTVFNNILECKETDNFINIRKHCANILRAAVEHEVLTAEESFTLIPKDEYNRLINDEKGSYIANECTVIALDSLRQNKIFNLMQKCKLFMDDPILFKAAYETLLQEEPVQAYFYGMVYGREQNDYDFGYKNMMSIIEYCEKYLDGREATEKDFSDQYSINFALEVPTFLKYWQIMGHKFVDTDVFNRLYTILRPTIFVTDMLSLYALELPKEEAIKRLTDIKKELIDDRHYSQETVETAIKRVLVQLRHNEARTNW